MTNDRKRPAAGFWAAVAVAVVLAYPLLLGPFCWLSSRTGRGAGIVTAVYQPLFHSSSSPSEEPGLMLRGLCWYSELVAANDWHWRPLIHVVEPPDRPANSTTEWAVDWDWTYLKTLPAAYY